MKFKPLTIYNISFLLLLVIGIVLHFYNLNWGSPYYFHPDERQNVAYPIIESKSVFLYDQRNFDIGTFPLIVVKLFYPLIGGFIFNLSDPLAQVIATARFFTAILTFSTAIVLFKIASIYFNKAVANIALFFMIFSAGTIQYSHFGTVEMWEAFFLTILLYVSLKISKKPTLQLSIVAGVIAAIAVSTKVLTVVALPALFLSFLINLRKSKSKIFKSLLFAGICFASIVLASFLIMPHAFLSFSNAYPSLKFESDVTLGRLPVFYTQGFNGSVPYLFQFTNVYPFLINPLLTIILVPSFLFVVYKGIREKSYTHLLVAIFFFAVFFFQGHFFAKWTRYYIPTLPFAFLIISIFISETYVRLIKRSFFPNLILGFIMLFTFSYALIFFTTVYLQKPSQIVASEWTHKNIPKGANVIAEPFDLGIGPFNSLGLNIEFVNFYEIDHDPNVQEQLKEAIKLNDYIILTSQRLVRSRSLSPGMFPISSEFYRNLQLQKGYKLVYQTPCDIYCKFVYLGNPILNTEETVSVFDRPIVTIYKKVK